MRVRLRSPLRTSLGTSIPLDKSDVGSVFKRAACNEEHVESPFRLGRVIQIGEKRGQLTSEIG